MRSLSTREADSSIFKEAKVNLVGALVGTFDGALVGGRVGNLDGKRVGIDGVGTTVGIESGDNEGENEGDIVGGDVNME